MAFAWKDQEKEILKKICESGGSAEEAAEILGRTTLAVGKKAEDLGLRFKGSPEIDMDAYEKYLKQKGLK